MIEKEDQPALNSVTSKPKSKNITITVPTLKIPKMPANERTRYVIVAVVILAACLGSGFLGGYLESDQNQIVLGSTSLGSQKQIVTSDSQLTSEIAKTVGPSVVSVNVAINTGSGNSGTTGSSATSGFGLFGFTQPEEEQAAGTGIIISSNGIIMTNRHVVPQGTTSVSVTLSNGTELKDVSVIGRTNSSSSLDIAFLKINNTDGQKLTPAAIGNSAQMQVGDEVVAIGNALGQFQNTVTSGIISGYGRSVTATADTGGVGSSTSATENLEDLFQTDAAINEGNSGGPLVDLNGQVIGINTAIAGNAQNIGFAIPVNDVKGLIEQVLKSGKFSVPYLGVRYIPLTPDVVDEYGLSVQNGAFIAPSNNSSSPSVLSNTPASNAGLKVNDIITQVNGTNIDQNHSLTSLIDQYTPGTTVNFTVIRSGQTIHVNVTLGAEPS